MFFLFLTPIFFFFISWARCPWAAHVFFSESPLFSFFFNGLNHFFYLHFLGAHCPGPGASRNRKLTTAAGCRLEFVTSDKWQRHTSFAPLLCYTPRFLSPLKKNTLWELPPFFWSHFFNKSQKYPTPFYRPFFLQIHPRGSNYTIHLTAHFLTKSPSRSNPLFLGAGDFVKKKGQKMGDCS